MHTKDAQLDESVWKGNALYMLRWEEEIEIELERSMVGEACRLRMPRRRGGENQCI